MACMRYGGKHGLQKHSPNPIYKGATMTEHTYKTPETDSDVEAKTRSCLICKTPFPSAWAGERICSRCKSTKKWRAGLA